MTSQPHKGPVKKTDMSNLFRMAVVITVAAITTVYALSQERMPRMSEQRARTDFTFQSLVATKSIDVATFGVGRPLQLASMNVRALSSAPTLAVKKSAEDDAFPAQYSTKHVPNRLGNVELFKVKPEMRSGFHRDSAANLNSSDVPSSAKYGLSDLK
jgi:hypothetical protein